MRHQSETIAVTDNLYTRHTSSGLGVAGVHTAESHSLSMLIDCLLFAPTSHSNYFGYIAVIYS